MRERLSQLITEQAVKDESFCVLSGDHGYALFDSIRKTRGSQFFNVGVAEQNMVGMSAGLARVGFRPFVYGLAAFIPVRVFEQIKLDVCFSKLPVIFLGDGAGLVYSTLGASHQCAEDLACLRALPNLKIFAPGNADELEVCFKEALANETASYIRLGKSDRPVLGNKTGKSSAPYFSHETVYQKGSMKTTLVTMGSFLSPCTQAAIDLGISCVSVPRIKPFPEEILELVMPYSQLIVAEEHNQHGGLYSSVVEFLAKNRIHKEVRSIALEEKFSHRCGTYQYALSEHGLDDPGLFRRIRELL